MKSLGRTEFGTDHYLVLVKIRQKLKIEKREKLKIGERINFKIQKIEKFKIEIVNCFSVLMDKEENYRELDQQNQVETMWNSFKTAIKNAAKDSFGKKKTQRNPWFNNIVVGNSLWKEKYVVK